jgi:hypothetical protein
MHEPEGRHSAQKEYHSASVAPSFPGIGGLPTEHNLVQVQENLVQVDHTSG